MARDAELDRLKSAQDHAFQRKQDAWQAQDQAWKRRSIAREAMNRAHEGKQRAYEDQEASWQDYQRVRSSNGPRIDQLNSRQESAFEAMKRAFDNASSAHDRRDGASARMYAVEGHRHKAESQQAVAERRRLVDEIRAARGRHEAVKPAFQRAKGQFDQAKSEYDRAKADHERKGDDFKRAKVEFDSAKQAFQSRLEKVKAENKRKRDDKRSIAARAGVPPHYRDNVWISKEPDGAINIYFGGVGEPNGLGHGHYVMDRNGKVTYRREPFDPHGSQNYEDNDKRRSQVNQWERRFGDGRGGSVKVRFNYNEGYTDIYYGGRGRPDGEGHGHIRVLEDGTEKIVREPSVDDERQNRRDATLLDSITPDRRH